jgi:lysozyme family protein
MSAPSYSADMTIPRDTIDQILTRIIHDYEGGYVNHPLDKGGPTKYGITLSTLENWRRRKVTADDVFNLSMVEALEIYRANYVNSPKFQLLNDAQVAAYAIDFGINSGTLAARQYLQKAAGVTADGIIGPMTIAAIDKNPGAVLLRYTRLRLLFLATIVEARPSQAVFIEGWVSRATKWMA